VEKEGFHLSSLKSRHVFIEYLKLSPLKDAFKIQVAFQQAARQFAKEIIIPAAADLDRTMKYPHEIFKQVS
jgi:hypothetical protein